MPIRDQLLRNFPNGVYGLTVVSDPDDLLTSEAVLQELSNRGFRVVMEEDPVFLRAAVEQLRPWTPDNQVIVLTRDDLRKVPFDLWQQAHKLTLSLHQFFPRLAYPILKTLSSHQRSRIAEVTGPERMLGETATIDWVLRHGFDLEVDQKHTVSSLVSWLNVYHHSGHTMPDRIRDRLVSRIAPVAGLYGVDVRSLLTDPESFERFMREQWQGFVRSSTRIEEPAAQYILDFASDQALQDSVAGLVRTGAIEPVVISDPAILPHWARHALMEESDDSRTVRSVLLLNWLDEQLRLSSGPDSWTEWKEVATNWAEFTVLRFGGQELAELESIAAELSAFLDERFLTWLQVRYTSLAVSSLPVPHHVHHIPGWLAQRREAAPNRKIAFIVMDGMSLADWAVISPMWRRRNPNWSIITDHVMAQLPTITAVSRQALVSGRRPSQFAPSITSNTQEPRLWNQFWSDRGVADSDIEYKHISTDLADDTPLASHRARALCWIVNDIDDIVHGATLGTGDVLASLQIWVKTRSLVLERGIQKLLDDGFEVVVASDHGHVQAQGVGSLSEGVAVESRGKRARTYRDELLSERAREAMKGTLIWSDDGLLPDDFWALLPETRMAFTTLNDTVVTHGGATIDEVIVPLITITTG